VVDAEARAHEFAHAALDVFRLQVFCQRRFDPISAITSSRRGLFSPPGACSYPTGPMSIATMLDTIKIHTAYQMRASIMSPSSSSIGISTWP
jgi:hypothetical protein